MDPTLNDLPGREVGAIIRCSLETRVCGLNNPLFEDLFMILHNIPEPSPGQMTIPQIRPDQWPHPIRIAPLKRETWNNPRSHQIVL